MAVIPVPIFILGFIILMPIVAICKDRSDYEAIKSDQYNVDNDLIRKMAVMKRQPFELVLYKKKLYSQYQITQVSCMNLFLLFTRNIHPLFSLFYKFDITLKRLIRFMGLSYQLAIVGFVMCSCFGTDYRADEFESVEREDSSDNIDMQNAIEIGIALSFAMLPLPNLIANCFRTKLVPESQTQK